MVGGWIRRSSASRISAATMETSSEPRQPSRFEKKTNTPSNGGAPPLAALHEPDDQRRAEHGQDDPAGTSQQHPADDPADDRTADSHEDRHADAHGVGPRDDEATQSADDQTAEDDPDDEQNHNVSLVFGTQPYPSAAPGMHLRTGSPQAQARRHRRARSPGPCRRTTARPRSSG